MTRHVVLVGAGHAHLEVLRCASRFAHAGIKLTLIDPGQFWYSGAATGVLSGDLEPQAACLDPAPLLGATRWHRASVLSVDPEARSVSLSEGQTLSYDVLSLNTGSRIEAPDLLTDDAIAAKPVQGLARLRTRLEACQGRMRLAVAGAGATGVEIALALAGLQQRLGARPTVMLYGSDLLPGWPGQARKYAADALKETGVEFSPIRVRCFEQGLLHLEDRRKAPVDQLVVATGLMANIPDGLEAGRDGLPVRSDLSWTEQSEIFAVGDCADLSFAPRPKLGVFGVRAAPILVENLIRAAQGRTSRKRYSPQSRWLSILDLGNGRALGRYGGLVFEGGWALRYKRWLDHRFIDRYRASL